jgi:hypothetical protein
MQNINFARCKDYFSRSSKHIDRILGHIPGIRLPVLEAPYDHHDCYPNRNEIKELYEVPAPYITLLILYTAFC